MERPLLAIISIGGGAPIARGHKRGSAWQARWGCNVRLILPTASGRTAFSPASRPAHGFHVTCGANSGGAGLGFLHFVERQCARLVRRRLSDRTMSRKYPGPVPMRLVPLGTWRVAACELNPSRLVWAFSRGGVLLNAANTRAHWRSDGTMQIGAGNVWAIDEKVRAPVASVEGIGQE